MISRRSPTRKPTRRPKINRPIAAAAGLAMATLIVHVTLGTAEILEPVMASDASPVAREVIAACWHLVTVTLVAMTCVYAYGMRRRTPALMLTWNLLAAAFGMVFVVVAINSGLGFGEVPQSIAFFAIAGAGFAGLNRSLYLPAEPRPTHRHLATTPTRPMPDAAKATHPTAH